MIDGGNISFNELTVVVERDTYTGMLKAYIQQPTGTRQVRGRDLLSHVRLSNLDSAKKEVALELSGMVRSINWEIK